MKIVNLIQGTPEWHAHRDQHHNASDAPAMMGCSPHKTRAQLVREVATGIAREVDAATQRRFDDGHRFEELARPYAEEIIGEELFPVTGTNGKLSASFDGLTMDGETAFEHKTLNANLSELVWLDDGSHLPLQYQVQMEQQLAVSDASRVLFMASKWDSNDELVEERHCWYVRNPGLRDKIVAGWAQFEADVVAYEPEAAKAEPVAAPIAGFGALTIRVEG
ncbi:MAG: lambda-exonuclease family protein, partial [Stenotrophomonas sp.]